VTREEILDTVWDGQMVEESNLTVQISALRKVLQEQKPRRDF
jgi:DNA-binding winged helix-turn-helix (wHTH) protein